MSRGPRQDPRPKCELDPALAPLGACSGCRKPDWVASTHQHGTHEHPFTAAEALRAALPKLDWPQTKSGAKKPGDKETNPPCTQ